MEEAGKFEESEHHEELRNKGFVSFFFGLLFLLLQILFLYIGSQVATMITGEEVSPVIDPTAIDPTEMTLLFSSTILGGFFFSLILLLWLRRRGYLYDIDFPGYWTWHILWLFPVGLLLLFTASTGISQGLMHFFNLDPELIHQGNMQEWIQTANKNQLFLVGLAVVVVAPFSEELLFRGLLLEHLRQGGWRKWLVISVVASILVAILLMSQMALEAQTGFAQVGFSLLILVVGLILLFSLIGAGYHTVPAVILTSLLFAILHGGAQHWVLIPSIFVLGCGLAALRLMTNNLLLPMVMHACFNAFSLVVLLNMDAIDAWQKENASWTIPNSKPTTYSAYVEPQR